MNRAEIELRAEELHKADSYGISNPSKERDLVQGIRERLIDANPALSEGASLDTARNMVETRIETGDWPRPAIKKHGPTLRRDDDFEIGGY